jgi:hypothetical protein
MTTDELERDLQALAEPHAGNERLRLAIRATLDEQLQRETKIRHRPRRASAGPRSRLQRLRQRRSH